ILRISDSLAFGAVARHIYAAVPMPDTENHCRLFVRAKNNLAPDSVPSLAFDFVARGVGSDRRLSKPIVAPPGAWIGHVDVARVEGRGGVEEGKPKRPTALDDAKGFLEKLLADGPVRSTEVIDAAKAELISLRTLERAKKDLGIVARRVGGAGAEGYWV